MPCPDPARDNWRLTTKGPAHPVDVQLLAGLLLVEAKKVTALALAKPASGAAGPGPSDRVVCDRPEVELIARLPWRQVVRRGAGTLSASEAATLAPGGRLFVVAAPRDVAALRSGARVLREDGDEVVLVIEPG